MTTTLQLSALCMVRAVPSTRWRPLHQVEHALKTGPRRGKGFTIPCNCHQMRNMPGWDRRVHAVLCPMPILQPRLGVALSSSREPDTHRRWGRGPWVPYPLVWPCLSLFHQCGTEALSDSGAVLRPNSRAFLT